MERESLDNNFGLDDEPPEVKTGGMDAWYYTDRGERKGPVSVVQIKDLLNKKNIDPDTLVWRKGMKDWVRIRESDLSSFVDSDPPPVLTTHIGNGLVWIIALVPLILGIINASIIQSNNDGMARFIALGIPFKQTPELSWSLSWLGYLIFGLWDERRVRKAGYSSRGMLVALALLPPLYLFWRAKRLKQRPWYAITWVLSFFLALLLIGAVSN